MNQTSPRSAAAADPTEQNPVVAKLSDLVRYIKMVNEMCDRMMSPDTSWAIQDCKDALLLVTRKILTSVQDIATVLTDHKATKGDEIIRSLETSFMKIKELLANSIRQAKDLVGNFEGPNTKAQHQACVKANEAVLAEISTAINSITKISQKRTLKHRTSLKEMRMIHKETIRMKKVPASLAAIAVGAPDQTEVPQREYSYSRSIRDQIQLNEQLPPVIQSTNLFSVDPETDSLVIPVLTDLEDVYFRDFFPSAHFNYIGSSDNKSNSIISVLKIPILEHPDVLDVVNLGSSYSALVIDKSGQRTFQINSFALPSHEEEKDVGVAIQHFLNERSPELEWSRVTDPEFPTDLLNVEKKHPRKILAMKVAVLYALEGQTDLREISKNQPPPDSPFYHLMNTLGDVITLDGWAHYRGDFNADSKQKSYYTVWRDEVEIMFHLAPWMNDEQHRRLIGNDICVLVFYDSPLNSFNPAPLDALGTVPQVFAVVQPYKQLFRFGSFNRSNLKPFLPQSPPKDYLFAANDIKDYLFVKLHNGMAMAWSCPPMNRLFCTPRAATIDSLAAKYPPKKSEKSSRKRIGPLKLNKFKRSEAHAVIVTVISGKNLVARGSGTSDPFASVVAGNSKAKTPVKMKTLNPVWNCEIVLTLDDSVQTVDVIVYDWDRFSADIYMGEAAIPIEESQPKWYPLISKTSQIVTGEIQIQVRLAKKQSEEKKRLDSEPKKRDDPRRNLLITQSDGKKRSASTSDGRAY